MTQDSNQNEETDKAAPSDAVDEAFVAYLKARDAGGADSREEFLARFPNLASQLGELLDAADLIEQLAGTTEVSLKPDPGADTLHGIDPEQDDHEPDATLPASPVPGEDSGPQLPFELGDYTLEKVIGRGGMGVVYLARQTNLDRPVAVKMIRTGMLAGSDEIKRFSSEAKAAARLKHPNIVAVHHFGQHSGNYYFSMDYVEGSDLSKKVDDGPQDFYEAAIYVRDVARAIHHAHEKGLLHRDLKPANVLIDECDQVHVTDFGLAKHVDAESSLTASGAAIGTPNYMAPEQANGDSDLVCRQSDVYSLGAILFALCTGRPPFVTDSVMQTLMHVIHKPAPALRSYCDAPHPLDTIVEKCLDKEPKERYESANHLAEDIDRFLNGQPIKARPRSAVQRLMDWLSNVPIFAALTGRRLVEVSESHRRFQTGMLLFVMGLPTLLAGLLFFGQIMHDRLPSEPKIAGGPAGDYYHLLAGELSQRMGKMTDRNVFAITTDGSLDNRKKLIDGEVHLAMLQANAVRGDQVSVIAPLYYEAVHILVRRDSNIAMIDQLKGKSIAVGPDGSGSRLAADMLFDSLQFQESDVDAMPLALDAASANPNCQCAIVCVSQGSPQVMRALTGGFRLLPIQNTVDISLDHPTFRPLKIKATDYSGCSLPESGVDTVGTTAFLATRTDAPSALVTATLEALYSDTAPVQGMITREHAAEWQGLALHPAARLFYESK